jgi:hypothetical protein
MNKKVVAMAEYMLRQRKQVLRVVGMTASLLSLHSPSFPLASVHKPKALISYRIARKLEGNLASTLEEEA